MKVDPFISELLYEHDCVIVADFGGFIASRKAAAINPALHLLSPPSKVLAFNAFLRQNDGVLANYIAQKNGVSYAAACNLIGEYVKQSIRILDDGKRIKIDNIGVLYRDSDSNLQFLPDQNSNYLVTSFGLSAVHSPAIRRSENAIPLFGRNKDKSNLQPAGTNRRRWKILEVVPAAAILAVLLMVPPALDQFNSNLSSLLPFSRINEYIHDIRGIENTPAPVIQYTSPFEIPPVSGHVIASAETVTNNQPAEVTQEVIAEVAVPDHHAAVVEETVVVPEKEISKTSVFQKFHIIGGCFKIEENAARFVEEVKGKGGYAEIIGVNTSGLYMVSLFQSNDYAEVKQSLPDIKSSVIPSAWIYRK